MKTKLFFSLLGALPVALMAFSTGPPPKRTGAPSDGGTNCTACHRTYAPANSDPRGRVRIDAVSYTPGVKQTIKVTVSHPDAVRWGFELTARLVSDETKAAGTFAANDVVRVICDDGSTRGTVNCQPGQVQFAEHSNAPRTDAGAGFTFSVDWTPTDSDLGDVVFYAAGNAADGSGSPAGDRIYTTVRRISPPCNLTVKPSITRMTNAASIQAPWSSGSLLAVFGANFGPPFQARPVSDGDIVDQRYPQSLACMAVTINGQNAPVLYVQPDQINLQAPVLDQVGPATVVVIANPGTPGELRSDPFTVNTQAASAPALFTFNGKTLAATSGDGSTIIANPDILPGAAPAKPGGTVVLYATGLGPVGQGILPGDIAAADTPVTSPVTVVVGGVAVPASDVIYAGLVQRVICGVQKIQVKLPATLPDGDVPVAISMGGAQSVGATTLPVRN